ncbi:flavin-containing monooxygenase 5-like [Babylonia areolata]|uniref:flavin-containing monooxygenase 5-like n=1 Tax=Babylonia areolata TaxID=304850 RepID=UPI003FD01327
MAKRVAIIGAGCSGLAAIKCCLDEGLIPVCFERSDEAGGLWRYSEEVRAGQACVMRSTVINTSKEMMCYSDFPVPDRWPNFLHNALVCRYLQLYARHFRLLPHIRYNTEVVAVTRAADFETTGRWDVKVIEHKNDGTKNESTETDDATEGRTEKTCDVRESTETYDAVLVCTGHHAEKNEPMFPGLADFQGQVIHSHDYRDPYPFVGKRIVIIGIGNSGGDLAVELSKHGQVLLSTRRGTWVIHRISKPGGLPVDIVNMRRVLVSLIYSLPFALRDFLVRRHLNRQIDHDLYSLTPEYSPLAQHPMVNDDLANRIACGSVVIKADVDRFTATGVQFVDGSFVDDVDVVFLATGYRFGLPFLDKGVVEVRDNRLPLYKYMFPPDLPHHTLATIGFIQPLGAIIPISEMQCRLATRVFKGEVKLPSTADMWTDIEAKEAAMAKRYVTSPRHTIQVDYISFMDELAELNGCKPSLGSLVRKDLALAWQVFTGPCTPYQYRLTGPGTWPGARSAIMTTMARVRSPLSSRPLPELSDGDRVRNFFSRLMMLFVFLLVVSLLPA